MRNMTTMIECDIQHCLQEYRYFNNTQNKSKRSMLASENMKRGIYLLLFLFIMPLVTLVGQHQKAIEARLQEDKGLFARQLSGSSSAIKQIAAATSVQEMEKKYEAVLKTRPLQNSSMTWSQLMAKVQAVNSISNEVTIYTGSNDQFSPQVAVDGDNIFVAFENLDTKGVSNPFGSIDLYESIDGGASWYYWDGLVNSSYRLSSPQVVLIGGYVVVTYHSNGYLYTARFRRSDGLYFTVRVPTPTPGTYEYIVAHRMVTDNESDFLYPWIYMAYLFRQANGTNKVLFSFSPDTASTWGVLNFETGTYQKNYYDSLAGSQTELGKASIGLDYSRSGVYLAYLGTGAEAHEIIIQKSINLGRHWLDKQILPITKPNNKVGPMVAAVGQRVAVVYQYDFNSNALDWKTGSDFDVEAVVSYDAGTSWFKRLVGYTGRNEILPWITHDADSNFYASFIRDGRVGICMAGEEIAFSEPDSSNATNVNINYFPSICASNLNYVNTAYVTWTGLVNGLDVYGADVALKIPPLSPSNLNYSVVSSTQIDLTWDDNSTDELGFYIYWRTGTTGDYTRLAIANSNSSSLATYRVSGLTPSTQYEFYVFAYNNNGSSLRTNILTASTSGASVAPTAPSNLTANYSAPSIHLVWMDNSNNEVGFRIERKTGIGGTFSEITTVGESVNSYYDSSIPAGYSYYYRVRAYNGSGLSGYSNVANATVPGSGDVTRPLIHNTTGTIADVMVTNGFASPVTISAWAEDNESGIRSFTLQYIKEGVFQLDTLQFNSPYYNTQNKVIPANAFVSNGFARGVSYRLVATNNAGLDSVASWITINVRNASAVAIPTPNTLPAASSYPSAEIQKAYRIFSVPYELNDKRPWVTLRPSLGDHFKDNVRYYYWRFQRYVGGGTQDYEEIKDEVNALSPGRGFFLIVRDPQKTISVGVNNNMVSAVRSDLVNFTGISLQSGWNLLGTPMNMNIPWNSLTFSGGNWTGRAYYGDNGPAGGWYTSGPYVDTLRPWGGLAVRMNTSGTVYFNTLGARVSTGDGGINEDPILAKQSELSANPENWVLRLNAYRSDIDMRCEGSGLGMAQNAKEGYDGFDIYIPPFVGDRNIAVYFKNPDGEMMQDIRPLNDEGGVWEMRVATGDAGARVKLQIGEKLNMPNPNFEAYLIDIEQKMAYNLKRISTLEISSGSGGVRDFRVVVGKRSYVEQQSFGVELTPSAMKLYSNYPNPFNPETVIRYTVSDRSPSYAVTLKIYNMLGQEIATLVNEQKSAGYYEVKWNASQQSSGIYFYEISITDGSQIFRDIKKMVLMK